MEALKQKMEIMSNAGFAEKLALSSIRRLGSEHTAVAPRIN
jgi:hypothetical protein